MQLNILLLAAKSNCIAQNVTDWTTVNETEIGVITKPYQVESMMYAYAIVNGIWFLVSLLLLFSGNFICILKNQLNLIQL